MDGGRPSITDDGQSGVDMAASLDLPQPSSCLRQSLNLFTPTPPFSLAPFTQLLFTFFLSSALLSSVLLVFFYFANFCSIFHFSTHFLFRFAQF